MVPAVHWAARPDFDSSVVLSKIYLKIMNNFYKSHGPMVLIIHLSMTIWISNMEMEQLVVVQH